ncbi:hypothetical protein F66182_1781 [Fusarium sp. NRRL 66182]|nr:hypothetical protein F66182_1781 [Fusarium sp. NRRL 66182]
MFASGAGGVHAWEMPIDKFNTYMLDVYVAAFIYIVCGSLAKLALLIFYLRISPQRWFKIATWTTLLIISGYTIGTFFAVIFACKPIAMSWDVTITEGTCINRPGLYIATAAVNIISDIILFVLPLPMVVNLQIPFKQKIGLMGIFTIGSLTVITSIVRVALLPAMLYTVDVSWAVAYPSVWIMAKTTKNAKPPSRAIAPSSQSRRDRNQYSQFGPEEGDGTNTIALGPVSGRIGHKISGGLSQDGAAWIDSDSEKGIVGGTAKPAIMQTTTVTVEYSCETL